MRFRNTGVRVQIRVIFEVAEPGRTLFFPPDGSVYDFLSLFEKDLHFYMIYLMDIESLN